MVTVEKKAKPEPSFEILENSALTIFDQVYNFILLIFSLF